MKEFFDGNDDDGSIGTNLYHDQPSLQTFHEIFKTMLSSDTDTVYIVGDVTMEEVTEMLKELNPSEIYSGWLYERPINISEVNAGKKFYSAWWD